jgi:hypothetical protein
LPERPQREQPRGPGEPDDLANQVDRLARTGVGTESVRPRAERGCGRGTEERAEGEPGDVAPAVPARRIDSVAAPTPASSMAMLGAPLAARTTIASAATGAPFSA